MVKQAVKQSARAHTFAHIMAHPSKRKGNRYERELVDAFQDAGLRAERAWGSNGCALTMDDGAHCALVREDRGETLAVMPLDLFTALLTKVYR